MEQEFQYKVSEPAEDYRDSVIEKSGFSTVKFTFRDIQKKQDEWSTEKRQLEGQLTVEKAKADNVIHHNPWISELSEKKQFTIWLYYEAMKTCVELQKQIDARIAALDEYQTEKEHIMDKLGFEKTTI